MFPYISSLPSSIFIRYKQEAKKTKQKKNKLLAHKERIRHCSLLQTSRIASLQARVTSKISEPFRVRLQSLSGAQFPL